MSDAGDWDLVARARHGDLNAFAELVRRYREPIVHFCLRMVGSIQDAEEVAQDAFVRVYRHLPRLEPRAKFSTFLFGVARNLALNAARNARRRGPMASDDLGGAVDHGARPDRAARLHEVESAIECAMQMLSPEHREVLVLREINGMDYETIAEITGCRIGTVKSRIARGREQLRQQMLDRFGDL